MEERSTRGLGICLDYFASTNISPRSTTFVVTKVACSTSGQAKFVPGMGFDFQCCSEYFTYILQHGFSSATLGHPFFYNGRRKSTNCVMLYAIPLAAKSRGSCSSCPQKQDLSYLHGRINALHRLVKLEHLKTVRMSAFFQLMPVFNLLKL